MKRTFSPFIKTYFFFGLCLLAVVIPLFLYTYSLSMNISINEGYAYLAAQGENLHNDLNRMNALIQNIGTYETVIQSSTGQPPLNPAGRYTLERARRELANGVISLSSNTIADCGIVFQNGICITINRSFESERDCFGFFIRYTGSAEDQWRFRQGLSSPGIYYTPEQKSFNGLVYAGNMRNGPVMKNRVFFIINMDKLLESWMQMDISGIELYGIDGSIIGSIGLFNPKESSPYLIEYRIPEGYSIKAFISPAIIRKKMQPALVFICGSVALFLLTGAALSVYFSQLNTKPLKNSLFERLLNGLIYTQNEWKEAARFFAELPPAYCLCLIRGYEHNSMPQCIAEFPVKDTLVHYIGNDRAVIILPMTEQYAAPMMYKEILERAAETMRAKYQVKLHIAVSSFLKGIEQLSDGYRQSRQILRLVTAHTAQNVFFEDGPGKNGISEERLTFPMEFTDSQRFYELLVSGDFEQASAMARRTFDRIGDTGTARGAATEQGIYHLFWSFEQVFIRIKAEHISEGQDSFPFPVYSSSDTVEELLDKILAASEQLCARIKQSNDQKETGLALSLISYINEKITDPMLNTNKVSREFGLSENMIQNLIHKSEGKTFFEYVDQKRMKKAYSLLTETDKSVNETARDCGFALVNSFYKSFRRHFGFSPSALRRKKE